MRIGIIGLGVMGTAFSKLLKEHDLFLFNRSKKDGVNVSSVQECVSKSEAVLLAVKPQHLGDVAQEMVDFDGYVMSILAGVTTEILQKHFPKAKVIAMMPNLCVVTGRGAIAIAEGEHSEIAADLVKESGLVKVLDESMMNAFSSICGSAPAFVMLMMEAMIDSAIALGFSKQDALECVLSTFDGAGALVKDQKKSPAEVKHMITSPGGTTIYGLLEMESLGVRDGVIQACMKTKERADVFSKGAE